jgi:hypothetical protein
MSGTIALILAMPTERLLSSFEKARSIMINSPLISVDERFTQVFPGSPCFGIFYLPNWNDGIMDSGLQFVDPAARRGKWVNVIMVKYILIQKLECS